jgi:predicted dithiol-disulfide oxidoreductase (DUF899 family)
MTQHKVGTREEWLVSRNELLERENEHAVPYYHQLLERTPKGPVDDFRAFRHDEYEDAARS